MIDVMIRTFSRESDIEDYVKFANEAHADYPGHVELTVDICKQYFLNPDFNEKSHLLAISRNKIIGSIYMIKTNQANVVELSILLKPDFRYIGIEKKLLDTILMNECYRDINEYRISIPSKFDNLNNVLHENNFTYWKSGYHMIFTTDTFEPKDVFISKNYSLESAIFPNDKESIINTLELGFQDVVDDTTNIINGFIGLYTEKFFDYNGVFVTKRNNNIVGVIINVIHPEISSMGIISWLTVLQMDRNKGLGKALLLNSLNWFKQKGVKRVELDVDLEVPSAVRLYSSCGFKVETEIIILRKFKKQKELDNKY
ncbi:MAG: GNAT family N-acetyltransferase [Methanobacteriota archaeon]